MKKRLVLRVVLALTFFIVFLSGSVFAAEKATVDEVYEKVLEGVQVVQELGEEALPAFNKKGGEFAWKDTFLGVVDCEKGLLVGTPLDNIRGMSSDILKGKKTGRLVLKEACENINPSGLWVEYWWPNQNTGQVERRLSFAVPASGTPYLVAGSIWDETTSVDELNKSLK